MHKTPNVSAQVARVASESTIPGVDTPKSAVEPLNAKGGQSRLSPVEREANLLANFSLMHKKVAKAYEALRIMDLASGLSGRPMADMRPILRDLEWAMSIGPGYAPDSAEFSPVEREQRLIDIARGCLDYGGGYRHNPQELEIFHHGIQTVINALTTAVRSPNDPQVVALKSIGANARCCKDHFQCESGSPEAEARRSENCDYDPDSPETECRIIANQIEASASTLDRNIDRFVERLAAKDVEIARLRLSIAEHDARFGRDAVRYRVKDLEAK